ncbi:MAG: hypothetical protein Q8N63_01200, partial [Nanoarchaeota archaeon]|nr:hypothetical protein [Nanoarchaeota archaeon]
MKRGLKFVVLFVAVNIFLISFVSAYANLAASANGGTASLVSITGIATGSLGNAIDQNSGTYYKSSKAGSSCCDGGMHINCITSFTEEINLFSSSNINKIDYDIYFYPISIPDFPFAKEGVKKSANVSIYQGGSWTNVVTNAIADGSVNGNWQNVQKIRVTVYTNAWYDCTSMCGFGCLSNDYSPVAQLNELKAWGFYCGDGTCDAGEDGICLIDCPPSCPAESNTAFCSRLEKECGSVTANDNCGDSRTVDNCGNCDTLYPGEERTCQSGACILPDRVFWADTNGNPITEASIGSTVWMIYENRAEQTYNFNIIEDDIINNDDIRTILSSESFDYGLDLGAEWIITQADFDKGSDTGELIDGEEEFKFIVNGIISEQLIVSAGNYNN